MYMYNEESLLYHFIYLLFVSIIDSDRFVSAYDLHNVSAWLIILIT